MATPSDKSKSSPARDEKKLQNHGPSTNVGPGGETHQTTNADERTLTTNQGLAIADDQSSLKSGARGPSLLEDFVLREKITHFDHERIPERIVHARGSAAHGYFQAYKPLTQWTRAAFLQDPSKKTPVFARFSTVAGGAGSVDTPRDVRGFAVKFYTEEGNFDLVGNNIPVFFIQDAMKFPDLVHAVKMEPDRGFPQAASAHDTFWDFVSLMPESMHMLMWAMSDRTLPRSLRMMEGFGVHTFRFVDAQGKSTFIKFHWRPLLGSQSTLWDEAVKLAGADPDFHRRDLWEAIDKGSYPEFELSVQAFDQATADKFEFDILDPTKLIPEEQIPLTPIGKMVLDRNPDNFFAETEQSAFHPGHVVPGIDFTNDPLLQGRLFSYLDTQLIRLGGPNFHQLPINRPRCPMRNFQRDGHMQMEVPKGRVNYEPNSLQPDGPRENPTAGFVSFAEPSQGAKVRARSETFSDHYSQARLFFRSMSAPEQRHIASAFAFELGKVETLAVRKRMLGHLALIERDLHDRVADELGMQGEAEQLTPARQPIDLPPSPALSIVQKAPSTLKGRKVGVLVNDGSERTLIDQLQKSIEKEGATMALIAPRVGGFKTSDGKACRADQALASAPSIFFDAVVLALSSDGAQQLCKQVPAVDFVRDAFGHLKVLGATAEAKPLLDRAQVESDEGVIELADASAIASFIEAAKRLRIWDREVKLHGETPAKK
jgi:catalase